MPAIADPSAREVLLTFSYRKEFHEQYQTGDGRPGTTRHRADLTLRVNGELRTRLEDPLPEELRKTIPLLLNWSENDGSSYSRYAFLSAEQDDQHFAMNAFGPPAPKWEHTFRESVRGSCLLTWSAPAPQPPSNGRSDIGLISFLRGDVERTFGFSLMGRCETTVERPGTSEPKRSGVEAIEIRLEPGDANDPSTKWQLSVTAASTGVSLVAHRTRTTGDPRPSETTEHLTVDLSLGPDRCDPTTPCPQGMVCRGDCASSPFGYRVCCPEGSVPWHALCIPDTPANRRTCCACAEAAADASAACGRCGFDCAGGSTCCTDKCADLTSDAHHCGSCETACAIGSKCCSGKCVDTRSDMANCGACGKKCNVISSLSEEPEPGVTAGSTIWAETCQDGFCVEKVMAECSGDTPVACERSCLRGGACCATSENGCVH